MIWKNMVEKLEDREKYWAKKRDIFFGLHWKTAEIKCRNAKCLSFK